ncbi:MAG: hypothetical protein WCF04_01515 [Candidatus Nanopelagicales bacterium]
MSTTKMPGSPSALAMVEQRLVAAAKERAEAAKRAADSASPATP